MRIVFFSNGCTGAFDEKGEQCPELQEPWFLKYVDSIKDKVNLDDVEFEFFDGKVAKCDGKSWSFKEV